jgi:hypothetical protein
LFVKKHYRNKPAWYILLLQAGIAFRKMLAMASLLFR